MRHFPLARIGLILAFLLVFSTSASAQAGVSVPLGGSVDVSNGTECPAATEAQIFLVVDNLAPVALGSVTTDDVGHVETTVTIPADQNPGPASVVIDCGIAGSVLVYGVTLTAAESGMFSGIVPLLAIAAVIVVLVALLVIRRKRAAGADEPTDIGTLLAPGDDEDESGGLASLAPSDDPERDVDTVDADAQDDESDETVIAADHDAADSTPGWTPPVPVAAEDALGESDDALADIAAITDVADDTPGWMPPEPSDAVPVADMVASDALDGDDSLADVPEPSPTAWMPPTEATLDGETETETEADDGAEYCIWDVETSRGPAKRLACLTESSFHLDEIPDAVFDAALATITEQGPATALANAYVSVDLDQVEAVHRRNNEIRVTYRTAVGTDAKVVDLGAEVDNVCELLSRHFPIHDVTPANAS